MCNTYVDISIIKHKILYNGFFEGYCLIILYYIEIVFKTMNFLLISLSGKI